VQHTVIEEVHGLQDSAGMLGHGDGRNLKVPTVVSAVCLPSDLDSATAPEVELYQTPHGVTLDRNWRAEQVACGLDHMAAIISMPERVWRESVGCS